MTSRAAALLLSTVLSLTVAACSRSEDLGSPADGGTGGVAGQPGLSKDDAGAGGAGGAAGCGGASCLQPLGTPCTSADMCASGNCVDKVCCDSACTGTCMACDGTGTVGTCTSVPACGQGLQPLGSTCTSPAGCASGYCVGGVCCNTACSGTCMSCNAAGTTGTCTQTAGCS